MSDVTFIKTGKEIKEAIQNKLSALKSRLEYRNSQLDKLLDEPKKLRSYILRSTQYNHSHGRSFFSGGTLYGTEHISSEEVEEISQMCKRVMEIEQEMGRLHLILKHLKDEQEFELSFDELVGYGFE